MADSHRTYGIAELAERGGVTRRTVRYYVRRGLLPAPTGTGRGNHYTDEHLDALVRIRALQEAGVPLAEIQRRLHNPDALENREPTSRAAARLSLGYVHANTWARILVEQGIELHVAEDRQLDGEALAAVIAAVRSALSDRPPSPVSEPAREPGTEPGAPVSTNHTCENTTGDHDE